MPSNYVELLRYRSHSDLLQTSVNLRRVTSEGSLDQGSPCSRPGLSMLSLSKTRISVGDNVTVYWDIRGNVLCGANDWIGLFELDGPMSLSNYLDFKQRGVTVARRGAIKWAVSRDVTLGEVEKKCIFKYIHATTGCVRAVSPTLYIYNPYAELTSPYGRQRLGFSVPEETLLEFSIAGLQASGLKKNIFGKPSPYVKLSIMPSRRHRRSWKQHHGQIAKTSSQSSTINPRWNSEEFVFLGGAEDLLEVEVRNKFSGARPAFSRFLGKLSIPLVDIFECGRNRPEEFTKPLGRRTPADRVQGTITLTITIIVPCNGPSTSTQQENVPPTASSSGAQRSNPPSCALSNPSLMSSAPNILRPLTLNTNNGFLETVFPVDNNTPSPVSPFHGFMGQDLGNNNEGSNCRRQLPPRPFSELYAGEFVPLDIDLQNQEPRRNAEHPQVTNGETAVNGNETNEEESLDEIAQNLEHSVELDSADELDDVVEEAENSHGVDITGNDSGMTLDSPQDISGDSEEVENQPMEIPEDSDNVDDSGIMMPTRISESEEEMALQTRGERNSVASIELTADSPLRILEESERVREEEIALSNENLLQDTAAESDNETEEMDTSEAGCTDETDGIEGGGPDAVMEEPAANGSEFHSSTQETLNDLDSLENQAMSDVESNLVLSENSLNAAVEEDLLDPTLQEIEEPVVTQSFVDCVQGPSASETFVELEAEESERTESVDILQLQEQSTNFFPDSASISEPQESIAERLEDGGGEIPPSLLEYVDNIVGNESVRNDNSAMPVQSATASNSSQTDSSGMSQNHVDSESSFEGSAVTLPMEASEPVCLDMTSLQTAAATEMLVDAPSAVAAAPTHETLEDGRGDEDVPFRPPRVKRISRSSSDPRSAPSRTHGERVRSNSREADGHSHSPGLFRPQLSRRGSVPQPRKVVVISGRASEGVGSNVTAGSMASSMRTDLIIHNDHTAIPATSDSRTSAVESVVVAVPVSSPPQRTSSSTTPSVVVADAVPEAVALVTPILSPDLDSERRAGAANGQSTVVAVPLSPEANTSAVPGSLRSQDRSPESRDEYVVIVPVPIRQASSAPSTLQRDGIPADTAPQASRTPSQHRNRPSQENSSVIYATPLSGQGGEVTAGLSSSLPRQSTTRVTALPEDRQRRRSSSSNSSSGRVASELPSTSYRISSARPAPTYAAPGDARSAAQQSGQSRPHDNTADGGTPGLAGSSNAASLGASATLPGPSTSSTSSTPQQSKEEIQTLLRTYWYSKSSPQNPQRPPLPGQLASTTEQTSSVGRAVDPSRRRAPPYDSQGRRNSGRRQPGQTGQQGQPVHVSIQDQQQTEQQQGSQEQQASNEETLPSNWERGVDSHGRVYYIDHVNRTTTWNRPRTDEPQSESNMNDMNTHWQSLDRRYQSFRRTLRGRSNRNSRPPIPTGNNRESQTAGEASSSISSPEGDAASPRPGTLPIPTASSAQGTSTPSSPSTPSTPPPSSSSAASSRAANLSHLPAVKFLTRSDFIDFLKSKGVAGQYYFQSQMLKLIVSKVRSDPNQFDKYRHQVELVRFLNQFADPQMEMPAGWDKKVDGNGRLYYINHNSRTTTFIDPRLPVEETTPRRNRAETEPRRSRVPPPRPPPPTTPTRSSSLSGPSTNLTYNQQVVGFLSQSNIDDILKQKYQGYARSPTLKASVRRVQTEGERALARLSNNLDFVMLLSVLEESIVSFVPSEAGQSAEPSSQPSSPTRDLSSTQASRGGRTRPVSYEPSMKSFMSDSSSSSSPAPYRRDFEAKVRSFHRQLYHNGYGQGPNKIKLSIRRDHILEDAFDQIMKEPARALRRNRLEIQFAGEEGLDYGGPAREFFFLLSRQLFNPYYGLFEYSANDTYTVQVSPVSLYVDNAHEWFCFCGRIIGLVIIHQHLLDAFFTRPFYKSLLRSACDLTDVEALDSLFHQSMTWVMENDITGVLDLSFTVSEEIFGQVTERELVTGGKEIEVSEDNKHDYVEQMVRWRVDRGVSEQMESIVNGFSEVLELNLISIFDARELELVISGTADIDVRDWRKNTEYRSGYHDSHKVVKWFWKAVSSFDNEQKLRLLQFVTGTSSIPYEGFAALRGSTGPRKFCIERWGEFSKLPRAHTCFNRLDLPVYRSYEELLEKLTFAVEESETFAMQ